METMGMQTFTEDRIWGKHTDYLEVYVTSGTRKRECVGCVVAMRLPQGPRGTVPQPTTVRPSVAQRRAIERGSVSMKRSREGERGRESEARHGDGVSGRR